MTFSVDPMRWWTALALLATYGLLCATIWWAHRQRERARLSQQSQLGDAAAGETRVLVAHGSQTGQAEQLAWRTAESLHLASRCGGHGRMAGRANGRGGLAPGRAPTAQPGQPG